MSKKTWRKIEKFTRHNWAFTIYPPKRNIRKLWEAMIANGPLYIEGRGKTPNKAVKDLAANIRAYNEAL